MDLPAKTLEEAEIVLDRERKALDPSKPEDKALYVERAIEIHDKFFAEVAQAVQGRRHFHWFYTGHTGAGKSTELNRIVADRRLTRHYVVRTYNIKDKLDLQNLEFADLLFGVADAVSSIADVKQVPIPEELREKIDNWGKEIHIDREVGGKVSGKGGGEVNLLFGKLALEIQTGGEKRKIIREKLRENLTQFIKLIDDLVENIEIATAKKVLLVIDGQDHIDHRLVQSIYTLHWASLSKPRVSTLTVLPLSMLSEQDFMAYASAIYSLLPNVKVFAKPGSGELDADGFQFFKDVLSRLADLDFFSEEALGALFRLSCGMVRDMIGYAGDATLKARRDPAASQVEERHVVSLLNERRGHFRRILRRTDYDILREIENDPYPLGNDGFAELLRLKALIFYPNGEGWYALHPAVQAILDDHKSKSR